MCSNPKRFQAIRETKYIKNRDATAKLRERAIYQRYFIKGEHLKKIAEDLGYKSLSAIEKAVVRVRKEYNLPCKREMTGEALDNPVVAFNNSNEETYLFYTNVQIEKVGFKKNLALHSLINETYTRISPRRKNSIKWYFVLAKDYKIKGYEDITLRKSIAKIKTDWIMK